MNWLEGLVLGFVQGLTEYLPVSSSGHLQIGQILLNGGDPFPGGLQFDITVHVATVLSTLVILWKEIEWIFRGLFKLEWNDETRYAANILVSMIPIGIVGLFFKDTIEALFEGTLIVGICLCVTALLLTLTHFYRPKEHSRITTCDAFVIGLAQACAVLPGLSRSGSTIATGLLLGNSRQHLAQFSFLMVIPPILGEALLDVKHMVAPSAEYLATHAAGTAIGTPALVAGFVAAFLSGCLACKAMIALVKRCSLIWFAVYCAILGTGVIIYSVL